MQLAQIINQGKGFIEFAVDDVDVCADPITTHSFHEEWAGRLESEIISASHDCDVIKDLTGHALVAAVHKAFAEHRPLELSPDVIWLTIAQGFSNHVNFHAEELRERFVRHEGKKQLTITTTSFDADEIGFYTELFAEQLAERVGTGLANLFSCDFTTSTEVDRTVSQITMMSALQKYFEYRVYCICGIPRVVLRGIPDDWRAIRARVDVLAEYELGWWTKRLASITDQLVRTAEGEPSLEFWKQICKPETAYGGELITGWITDLFPYLKEIASDRPMRRNELLKIRPSRRGSENGVALADFPEGFSEAPMLLETPLEKLSLSLVGGFAGVALNDAVLRVETGWAVRPLDPFLAELDALAEQHGFQPREIPEEISQGSIMTAPDRVTIAFSTRFAQGALAWGERRLELLHPQEVTPVELPNVRGVDVAVLDDGRRLVSFRPPNLREQFFAIAMPGVQPGPASDGLIDFRQWVGVDPTIVADDAVSLLDALRRSTERAFFDEDDFQPKTTWSEMLAYSKRAREEEERTRRMRRPVLSHPAALDGQRTMSLFRVCLKVPEQPENLSDDLLGLMARRLGIHWASSGPLPLQSEAFANLASRRELDLLVTEELLEALVQRLDNLDLPYELETKTVPPPEAREVRRYSAALRMTSESGEALARPTVDGLSTAIALRIDSHARFVRQFVKQVGRSRWIKTVLPVFGSTLEEVEQIAAEISADARWGVVAVADVGSIASGGKVQADQLVGGTIDELFGSVFERSRGDELPHVLYLRLENSARVHRFHIDRRVLFWGDYGRVMEGDFEDGDLRVDYTERWGLGSRRITDAAVRDDRIEIVLEGGARLTYAPLVPEDDAAASLRFRQK